MKKRSYLNWLKEILNSFVIKLIRTKPKPVAIPDLPFKLILYVNLKNPGEKHFSTELHEPHVVKFLLQRVKKGWVVFDIGSFIGFYSVLFGKLCGPEGKVIAFEPVEDIKKRILVSGKANNLENIKVEQVAVGKESGIVKLWLHRVSHSDFFGPSSSLYHNFIGSKNYRYVKMTTVDKYMNSSNLSRLDLIKIDAEGAELDVLLGAEETLKRWAPMIIVEFNTKEKREKGEKFLSSLGYICTILGRTYYGEHVLAVKENL